MMMRVRDDDQRGEGSLGEILTKMLLAAYGDKETRARRGVEEEERNRFLIDTVLSVTTEYFFGRRKTDELDSRQNPNYHDTSSSSKSSVPIRLIIKPPSARGKSIKDLSKQGKVLWGSSSSHGHANENMEDTVLGLGTEAFLGKRKRKIDEFESQQNPNRQDASSSSMSSVESTRSLVVPEDEPIRAEPIREIKPRVRRRGKPPARREPVRREPVRRESLVMPEWLVNLMREENAADAKLVTEKGIKASDVKTQQSRLLIPFNQIEEMDFLNEAELNIIEEDRSKARKEGVPVTLVDSSGRKQWNVSLKRWDMKTSSNYLLNSGWNGVVRHHGLEENQTIRLWSFHSQKGKLFFALELVPPPPPAPAMDSGPDMALAPALTQAPVLVPLAAAASSSASTPASAPVATSGSQELYVGEASRLLEAEEERNRIRHINFPKRRRT